MDNAHVDTTSAADGTKQVVARFDLAEPEIAAVARAVDVSRTEQFRHEQLSTDDVVAMRELTALADQLTALAGYGGAVSVEVSPARRWTPPPTRAAERAHAGSRARRSPGVPRRRPQARPGQRRHRDGRGDHQAEGRRQPGDLGQAADQ